MDEEDIPRDYGWCRSRREISCGAAFPSLTLEDGHFEIDNNLAENAVRPLKLGAKNWLFFGSQQAGHNAAVIYTLVENCRRHGIPVEEYLCELLTRLPGETDLEIIASLTPASKAAARREKSAAA